MRFVLTVIFLFLLSAISFSQGINFEKKLVWEEIISKAKAEQKYIFVDCYATWCQPCKEMEQDIFSTAEIRDLVDKYFISIKVQMDTTTVDNEATKRRYKLAHHLKDEYNVSVFPTFLFFSPQGEIVHKGVGFKSVFNFKLLLRETLTFEKQYFTILKDYKAGIRNYPVLQYFIPTATAMKDNNIAKLVADDYI